MTANADLAVSHCNFDVATRWAPLRSVIEQVGDRPLDRRQHSLHSRLLQVGRERDRRPVAPGTLDRLGGDEVEADLLRLRRLLLAARKVDQLRDQRRHLGQLLDDVAEKAFAFTCRKRALTRENLDVRPQARQRRAQLVRSICDELTLSA